MSLFSSKDIVTSQLPTGPKGTAFRCDIVPSPRLLANVTDLINAIGDIRQNEVIPFATGGKWSMHQLMEYLLIQTGPCKLWFTTWTISEDAMRAMVDMIQKGLITELNAVLDYRIERRKPEAFQLAANIITNIKLTKCHAKVLILTNADWQVSVMGSANFSKNPRLEAGVIFTDATTAQFNINWIAAEINRKEGSND